MKILSGAFQKESSGRNRYLSEEELHTLLAYCQKSTNRNLYGMVLIAAAMGLRFGEIANLCWKHIDFNRKLITLEITKNGDRRVVPMPNQVSSYLSEIPGPKMPEKHVFPSKNSTNKSASLIRKAFQKAIKLSDLQDFRFHDLRHTCASHLAMNGATQGELMEVLGHRSPVMTKRYAHFSKEHIAKILQKPTTISLTLHEELPMALTKHQKLAKQIKLLLEALEDHFQKTAVILNALQFHFYETHLIIGRPLMSEKKLQLMMRVHKCGMAQLSSKQELREAAENVPLIGFVLRLFLS